ncbi:MAG: ABC transporter permease [Candidatus Sumerlaeaceae bacterium]
MTRFVNFLFLLWMGVRDRWSRVVLSSFALAFAVAVTLASYSVGFGLLRPAVRRAEEMFPKSIVSVRPKALDIAAFRFNATTLDDSAVEKLARLDGVEFVAPQLSLKMPLRAEGDIMGQSATSDLVVVGIDPKIVQDDVDIGFRFDYDKETSLPIPCIVPHFFLDMYNLAYADSLGLPKISERYPIGKEFSLVLGETYLFGADQGKVVRLPCRIVGITRQTPLTVGVLIPLGHAKALNDWYHGARSPQYNAVHVKLADLGKYDQVTSAIHAMGYVTESPGETLDKFLLVVRIAGISVAVFTLLVGVVAAVAVFNVYSLAILIRQAEFQVLRAVGATKSFLACLLLADAAIVGAWSGTLGGGAALLVTRVVERALSDVASQFSFLPAIHFVSPTGLIVGGVMLGMAVAIAITAPLVWLAVRNSCVRPTSAL